MSRPLLPPLAVASLLMLGLPTAGLASPDWDDSEIDRQGEVRFWYGANGDRVAEAASSGHRLPDGQTYVALPRADYDAEVGHCRSWRWLRTSTDQADTHRQTAQHMFDWTFRVGMPLSSGLAGHTGPYQGPDPDQIPDCPGNPATLDPAQLRPLIWGLIQDQLPRPELAAAPGWFLTGMPVFLETNRELVFEPVSHHLDLDLLEAEVIIEATGWSTIDWGDGRILERVTDPGGPYPHGQLRHTYASIPDTGAHTITVTDHWQVTFTVPGLFQDQIQASLAPVELTQPTCQLQAVRTSGHQPTRPNHCQP